MKEKKSVIKSAKKSKPEVKQHDISPFIPFVGYVVECHNRKYVEMSALNPITNDQFKIRVYLKKEYYDQAVRCLVHKIPVRFEGETDLRPSDMSWIMVMEKPRYFEPTQKVDLKEEIDEQNINPKPKKKRTIKLNPRQWNVLMQDAIEWIEEDLANLKDRFVDYLNSPTCQFIEGQQNTGMSLLGSITSLSNTVNRAKEIIEAHFEDRFAVIRALEKENK